MTSIKKTAQFISIIFGPHVWFPVILISLVLGTGLSFENVRILLPTLFLLLIIIPLLTLQLALKFKFVHGWDLPRRKERYGFLVEFIICCLVSAYLFINMGMFYLGRLR